MRRPRGHWLPAMPGWSLPFGPYLPRHPQRGQYSHEGENPESKSTPSMMGMSCEARLEKPSEEQSLGNVQRRGRQAGVWTVSNEVQQDVRY